MRGMVYFAIVIVTKIVFSEYNLAFFLIFISFNFVMIKIG